MPAGKTYEMPYPIKMKATSEDEEVLVTFVFENDMKPLKDPDKKKQDKGVAKVLSEKKNEWIGTGVAVEPGRNSSSRSADDVASLASTPHRSGILEVIFKK